MTEIEQPNFFSILPADVRYDENLTSLEKLLYSEITSLCDKTGSCWARNEYFAELFGKRTETISRNLRNLEKKGKIIILYKRRGAQITERAISIYKNNEFTIDENVNGTDDKNINRTIDENVNGTDDKNINRTIDENVKENNININNIKNKNIINNIFTKKYGIFKNVILSDEEVEKLRERYKDNFENKINNLSTYMKSRGKKYKSHYATLLCWDRREASKNRNSNNMMERIDNFK